MADAFDIHQFFEVEEKTVLSAIVDNRPGFDFSNSGKAFKLFLAGCVDVYQAVYLKSGRSLGDFKAWLNVGFWRDGNPLPIVQNCCQID